MFYELPIIIDGPGRYETRCGETVVIESIDKIAGTNLPRSDYYACRGHYLEPRHIPETWHVSGRNFPRESLNDIVKKCS